MATVRVPESVCRIHESGLWSAMQADAAGPELGEAIRLGRGGRKAEAYRRLGEYHRRRLAGELSARREQVLTTPVRTLQTPEDLLRHRVATWHTTVAEFGEEIDWNFAETDQYGFHYLGWLRPGTRRFMETGDPAYRDCLTRIVASYYRARNRLDHPAKHGMHLVFNELGCWAKNRELLPLYLELLARGDLPTDAHEAFMKLFLGFARSLFGIQNAYHPGNWQMVGCGALFTLARVFPEFKEAGAWEERALHYLKQHLAEDFFADGCHKERCWGYGHMSLGGITETWQVARRHGGLGADEPLFRRGIRNAYRWYAKTLGPTEHMPAYGDGELGAGKALLDAARPYFPKAAPRRLGVAPAKSWLLKASGFAILRNGGGADAVYANLNFGQFAGWHAHMDLFNLNLWAFGQPLLEELARFGGYGEGLSLLCRAPESHNQLTIDGMHYDNTSPIVPGQNSPPITGCGWDHPTFAHLAGRDPVWRSTPEVDFFTAWHGAYRANWREPQTIDARVRRTVVFVKDPGYLLVSDVAWETASNNEGPNLAVTQNWHATRPFEVVGPGRAVTASNSAACLLAFAPEPCLRRLEAGTDYTHDEAPGARDYPDRYYLRARRWMPVEHRGATGVTVLLCPCKGGGEPAVGIETLPLEGAPLFRAGAFAVTTPRGRDVIALNPDRLPGISFQKRAVSRRGQVWLQRRGRTKTLTCA